MPATKPVYAATATILHAWYEIPATDLMYTATAVLEPRSLAVANSPEFQEGATASLSAYAAATGCPVLPQLDVRY
eukprot:3446169-Rhodomonas_salina.2